MTRYAPSRNYFTAAGIALVLAALSFGVAFQFTPALIPAVLFVATGVVMLYFAFRPAIELHSHHLRVGERAVPWPEILRVDRTGWFWPLVVNLSLTEDRRMRIVFPGDYETSHHLLRRLRRGAFNAAIDGVPYQQFWAEPSEPRVGAAELAPPPRRQAAASRYPLLRAEDEAEIERLYQRLKVVGHLDPKDEG